MWITLIAWFVSIVSIIIGFIVLRKNAKSQLGRLFFGFVFLLAVYGVYIHYIDTLVNNYYFKLSFLIGSVLLSSGFSWLLSLCKGYNKKNVLAIYGFGFIFGSSAFIDGFFVKNVEFLSTNISTDIGYGYYFYTAYAFGIVFYGTYISIATTIKAKGLIRKKLQLILTGLITFALVSIIADLLLPFFGIHNVAYLNSIAALLFVALSAWAIIKYPSKD